MQEDVVPESTINESCYWLIMTGMVGSSCGSCVMNCLQWELLWALLLLPVYWWSCPNIGWAVPSSLSNLVDVAIGLTTLWQALTVVVGLDLGVLVAVWVDLSILLFEVGLLFAWVSHALMVGSSCHVVDLHAHG